MRCGPRCSSCAARSFAADETPRRISGDAEAPGDLGIAQPEGVVPDVGHDVRPVMSSSVVVPDIDPGDGEGIGADIGPVTLRDDCLTKR